MTIRQFKIALLSPLLAVCALPRVAVGEALCVPMVTRDWVSDAHALSMPLKPTDCERVDQSPPGFSWPEIGHGPYEVEIVGPGNVRARQGTEKNWLLLARALPAGAYRWRVHPAKPGTPPSEWRRFEIAAEAVPFVVPEHQQLVRTIRAKKRPRAFPRGDDLKELVAALGTTRVGHWKALVGEVEAGIGAPLQDDRAPLADIAGNRRAYSIALADTKRFASRIVGRMTQTAFAWKITGDSRYLAESLRLFDTVAGWDARGATGANHHQVAGQIIWSLALVRDWLDDELDEARKRAALRAAGARIDDLFAEFGIVGRRKLDKMPFNSHAWVALGEIAAASTLFLGDDVRAEAWAENAVRPFLSLYSPWGGHDGGFGNGMAYGVWDQLALTVPLDIIRHATGVNPWAKGWSRRIPEMLAYFMPPGAPTAVFGDGAEKLGFGSEIGDLASVVALRMPTATSEWYRRQWPPSRPGALVHGFAPVEAGAVPAPPRVPAHHAKSVGWTAMHSTLSDRGKVSVYFKSSPYGSFSHSHADQNSFVLHAHGQPLLIDSGFYDYRGSSHGVEWYLQTRAHNAVTFDDGQGQRLQQKADDDGAAGRIVDFAHSERVDHVTGDSTAAYGGALGRALRTLAYFRPGHLVVYDMLESSSERRWEWNVHALAPFRKEGGGRVRLAVGAEQLCIDMQSSVAVEFEQTDRFATPPDFRRAADSSGEKQWHGRFVAKRPTRKAAFVAVISVGCGVDVPRVLESGEGRYAVRHGATTLTLTPGGVIR